ncbi:MAG: hypothetical protein AAGD01_16775 [Acidobacteriota bacterium]
MKHDEVKLDLPWYLTGSLEESERRRVEDHLAQDPDVRQELEETRFAAAVFAYHPEPEALVQLVFGPQESPSSALVQRHVDACEHCQEEIELLRRSLRDLEAEEGKALHQPLSTLGPVSPPRRRRARREMATTPRDSWRWLAAAAAIIALVASAGWFRSAQRTTDLAQRAVAMEQRMAGLDARHRAEAAHGSEHQQQMLQRLRQTERDLVASREAGARWEAELRLLQQRQLSSAGAVSVETNTAVIDLYPRDLTLRGGESADLPTVELAQDARFLTLLLLPPGAGPYDLEVVDEENRSLATASGLLQSPTGDAALTLALDQLDSAPSGPLTVRLYAPGGKSQGAATVAEYAFQLRRDN